MKTFFSVLLGLFYLGTAGGRLVIEDNLYFNGIFTHIVYVPGIVLESLGNL